ncbi:hypothetical protein [Nocardioides sp. B-3]|uniref:hypothetical protein n=1 Tax=Nocardioides sp. B-3 TaxID=2895565 RepID=UPI0021528C56|nr:hypothetical protein [Nocardioides sp. B-3]UUZ61902.1 hypothetical protein LP418_18780 [Nocardioides sp. B-3]
MTSRPTPCGPSGFRRCSRWPRCGACSGVVLTGLVIRLYAQETAVAERRELAASL